MSDNVDVKIGADVSEAASGISSLQGELSSRFGQINETLAGFAEKAEGVAEVFKVSMESIMGPLAAVSAGIAGALAFKSAIDGANSYASEVKKLSNTMGIGSKEASDLSVSLKLIGVSADEYAGMAMKLDRQVKSNSDGLKAMGMETRDASGQLLSQQELIQNAAATMMTYAAGTDRNAAAMDLFGRNAESAQKIIKLNADAMARGKDLAKELGLELGGEALEASKKYQMQMREMSLVVESFEHKLGEALIPALTTISEAFVKLVVTVLPVFQAAFEGIAIIVGTVADAIKEFSSAVLEEVKFIGDAYKDAFGSAIPDDFSIFESWINFVKTQWVIFKGVFLEVLEELKFAIESIVISFKTFALVANAALKLDFSGAKAAWDKGAQELEASATKHGQKMVQIAQAAASKVKAIWSDQPKEDDDAMPKGGNKPYQTKEKDGSGQSKMAEWKAELDQKRDAEGEYHELSKQEEIAFWSDKLAQTSSGTAKEKAIHDQVYHELVTLQRQAHKEQQKEDDDALTQKSVTAKGELAVEVEKNKTRLALGEITNQEMLSLNKEAADKEYQIQLDLLQQKSALYDQDVIKQAAVLKQIEALSQAHELELAKIDQQAAANTRATWDAAFSPMTSAFSTAINGIIQGTNTLQNAVKKAAQSMVLSYADAGVKMLADQAKTSAMRMIGLTSDATKETALEQGLAALKKALGMETAATEVSTAKVAAAGVIPAEAATAAGAAASSVAGIPIVGPGLAAAAYAETMNMVMGGLGVASSAGGDWNVGSDRLNFVHKNETILPAHIAQPMREAFSGGAGIGGDTHLHVHAVDAPSVERLFRDNGHLLAREMRRQARNFAPTKA